MEISYDPAKNAENIANGRPSFDEVAGFDFKSDRIVPDTRKDYGEARYIAYGLVGGSAACTGLHRNPGRHAGYQLSQSQQARGKAI